MTKIYTKSEIAQRLAKHIRDTICRVADDIQDLAQRERFKFEALTKADAQFEMAPGPGSEPVHGGAGIPPGQLNQTMPPPESAGPIDPNVGTCPMCGMEDKPGSCTCLNSRVPVAAPAPAPAPQVPAQPLALSEMAKSYVSPTTTHGISKPVGAAPAPKPVSDADHAADKKAAGLGKEEPAMHPGGLTPDKAKVYGDKFKQDKAKVDEKKMWESSSKEAQAVRNGTSGKPWLKAEVPASGADKANPGANKDPGKQQPTKPVEGAVLPEGPGDKIKNKADDNKVKKNPLGKEEPKPTPKYETCPDCEGSFKVPKDGSWPEHKFNGKRCEMSGKASAPTKRDAFWLTVDGTLTKGTVPMAKPPSGATPGGSAAPPMASNTSKPSLGKAAVPPNPVAAMKQHALAQAPVPGAAAPAAAKPLTHPGDMGRATAHASALGGAFAPPAGKPPVSGLSLAPPKPQALGVAGPAMAKPVSGLALAPPKPQRPGVAGPVGPPPVSGLQLKRSECCPFCNLAEHRGDCTKK